ncbi:transketolase [Ancylobacter novellus DSM 506]|uniref:Transketolase n=1 Tax=Ancylobacter novellus (strain ATCC 8093 / DSM 506 / JCM 20403 / CCM 1077 / IAM 12100 / NBRC 12443 / NCIMB 10456) TaxID=639283 RepID=D7A7B3_ANCN5|nr:transketolase [Ancylobacter novellus]ADH90344.1 transketolase [Ancylobacter novellus DSM 506]
MSNREKHDRMANAIRALAMDAVEAANSGHPGMPMGMADVATVLFGKVLKFDPTDPQWPDRDRFILSAGHGSMLIYSLLYLTGYEGMTLDDIKHFRQLGSRTPGHPEYGHTVGIETTTGPLGQGLANSVGFALAERMLNAQFGDDLVDHHTYVICGDGCLMEGISEEAIELAGRQKLGKLIVLWDDNHITIDGSTALSVATDQLARFEASGWEATRIDGHDPDAILAAIEHAKTTDKPSLIACRTTIGYGAPNKGGTNAVHGAPLGAAEIAAARAFLNWEYGPFEIPSDVLDAWRLAGLRSRQAHKSWSQRLKDTEVGQRAEFERRIRGELPSKFGETVTGVIAKARADGGAVATRKSSEIALEALTAALPEMVGGSADLTHSNNTKTKATSVYVEPPKYDGRYINYGIREHGMAAAMNGIALHGGFIPYGGTFLVFSDYARGSIRLAALMGVRVVYVFTHDSIGVGEDGPTHQPVEHLAALRAIPNLTVFRPCDTVETAEAWKLALEHKTGPSVLALTRQNLPLLRTDSSDRCLTARGAYELAPASDEAQVSLFASGSEVSLAMKARETLQAQGIPTRVVSVPCFELFLNQPEETRRQVVGKAPVKIAIEAAIRQGWSDIVGSDAAFVGMTGFGASGPAPEVFAHFGITPEGVVATALSRLKR